MLIKIPMSLKTPRNTHSPSFPPFPSQGYHILGKEIEVCGSGSPSFFPVIRAGLAGLPRFPALSAVSLSRSPVLNLNPRGTFSWPTSKSPFTPFLPAASLLHSSKLLRESSVLLLHLASLIPKLHGKGNTQSCLVLSLTKTVWSPLSCQSHMVRSFSCQSHVVPTSNGCCAWV